MPEGIHHTSPNGVFGRPVSRKDSATSMPLSPFVPASRFITPTDDGRVATALPRNCLTEVRQLSEPSPGTPLGFHRVLLRPHSPTTAFHDSKLPLLPPS
jgi:hypothetical protein